MIKIKNAYLYASRPTERYDKPKRLNSTAWSDFYTVTRPSNTTDTGWRVMEVHVMDLSAEEVEALSEAERQTARSIRLSRGVTAFSQNLELLSRLRDRCAKIAADLEELPSREAADSIREVDVEEWLKSGAPA